jgi:hypothetical protein
MGYITRDLLGKCLRHSFGMPSIPQAFPSFKDRISFEMSHGQNLTGGVFVDGSQQSFFSFKNSAQTPWKTGIIVDVFPGLMLRNGVHNTILLLLGADNIENTASSIVA